MFPWFKWSLFIFYFIIASFLNTCSLCFSKNCCRFPLLVKIFKATEYTTEFMEKVSHFDKSSQTIDLIELRQSRGVWFMFFNGLHYHLPMRHVIDVTMTGSCYCQTSGPCNESNNEQRRKYSFAIFKNENWTVIWFCVQGDSKKYSCLVKREMHNKRELFKNEIRLECRWANFNFDILVLIFGYHLTEIWMFTVT